MSIPGTATRRPVAVAMLFLAVVLLGSISFVRLPIDLLPDVSYPQLVVYTSYPDVAPAEVERLVTELRWGTGMHPPVCRCRPMAGLFGPCGRHKEDD